jgi:hypothetical protein
MIFLGVCLAGALLLAASAHAQTNPSLYLDGVTVSFMPTQSASNRTTGASLLDWQTRPLDRLFTERAQKTDSSPQLAQRAPRARRSRPYRQAQRLTAAVAMGVMGSLAGLLPGAAIGSAGGDDGALAGMAIGIPIGAVAGATLGVILTK